MKIITTLVVRDRRFEIVLDSKSNHFCAIEDKYIDADGKLNTALNGFQMHASRKLEDCIETTRKVVEIDYLESIGYSKAEAVSKAYGFPVEVAEKLLMI